MALADQVVVMEDGHIRQAAPPQTVFERPLTPFVARFIGGHNVFSAPVTVENDQAVMQLDDSRITLPGDFATGQQAHIAVRCDRMQFDRQGEHRLAGTVTAIEYQGAWVRVALTRTESDEFTVLLPDHQLADQPLAVGDRVLASWGSTDTHLLQPH